jgi:hypothetical protein
MYSFSSYPQPEVQRGDAQGSLAALPYLRNAFGLFISAMTLLAFEFVGRLSCALVIDGI